MLLKLFLEVCVLAGLDALGIHFQPRPFYEEGRKVGIWFSLAVRCYGTLKNNGIFK